MSTGPLLAFAGRITKQKALEVALDALGRVEGVTLAIAGDGPDLPDLRRKVAELGLDGRVRFLGPLDRDDVLTLFRAADASLLTSSWENFPHTVVEALAVGTPVIATRVGGVPELVRDGENGLLVPAGDGDALAAAIRRLHRRARPSGASGGSGRSLGRASAAGGPLRAAGGDSGRGRAMSGEADLACSSSGAGESASRSAAALERRFEALSGELDWRQLGTAADGKPVARLAARARAAVSARDCSTGRSTTRGFLDGSRESSAASSRTRSSHRGRRRPRSPCSRDAWRGRGLP